MPHSAAEITQEETFGPVVAVSTFDGTEASAIELANDSTYGVPRHRTVVVYEQYSNSKVVYEKYSNSIVVVVSTFDGTDSSAIELGNDSVYGN